MARPGITYNEVAKACEKIKTEGGRPSINGVRNVLGTGSPNNLSAHIKTWRDAHQPEKNSNRVMPAAVIVSITNEIERCVAEEKANLEEVLSNLEEDHAQVVRQCDKLDEALLEEQQKTAKARDRLQASNAAGEEKDKQIESLQRQVEQEICKAEEHRVNTETSRIELAKVLIKQEVMERQIEGLPALQKARTEAEKIAEVTQAKEAAIRDAFSRMESEMANATEKIKSQELELKAMQARLTEAQSELGNLRVESATLQERLVSRENRLRELENIP